MADTCERALKNSMQNKGIPRVLSVFFAARSQMIKPIRRRLPRWTGFCFGGSQGMYVSKDCGWQGTPYFESKVNFGT